MADSSSNAQMTKEFQQMTKAMVDAIKGQSKMDMFPSTSDEKINDSMDRTLNDILKKMDDIQKKNLLLSKKQLAAANKLLKEKGLGSGKESSKDLALKIDQAKAMRQLARRLQEFDGKVYDSQEELDKELESLEKIAAKANLSMNDLGITTAKSNTVHGKQVVIVKHANKTYKKLDKTSGEVLEAFEEINEESKDLADKMDKSKTIWGKVGDAIKFVTGDFIKLAEEERRYAQQTATADAGWIKGLMSMRISTLEYMKILKDTRIENLAMTASGKDFTASLIASQDSLVGFTKDSTEAAEVAASFHKSMSRIGVSQDQLGDAISQQSKIYKENYRVLGYTAEEFSKLSDELINTQGMRSVLLNLQEKERRQYVLGIQQRMAEYQTMGYTIERAKELQATFQALNAMNPKERMKQAAKTRAMMGALGMGTQGEELFNLQTQYRTMSADQKVEADKRMAEIQSQAASVFGAKSGSGASVGQAMSFQMIADKTGFTQIAEKFETASGEGLKIDAEQLEMMKKQADHNNEVEGWQKELLKNMDGYNAAERTALGTIATNTQKGLVDLGAYNAFGFAVVKMGIDGITNAITGVDESNPNAADTEEEDSGGFFSNLFGAPKKSTVSGRMGRNKNKPKNKTVIKQKAATMGAEKPIAAIPAQTLIDTAQAEVTQGNNAVAPSAGQPTTNTTAQTPSQADMAQANYYNAVKAASASLDRTSQSNIEMAKATTLAAKQAADAERLRAAAVKNSNRAPS